MIKDEFKKKTEGIKSPNTSQEIRVAPFNRYYFSNLIINFFKIKFQGHFLTMKGRRRTNRLQYGNL